MRAVINLLLVTFSLLAFALPALAGKNPDVTSHSGQYLDRALQVQVQWHSLEPVVRVQVTAGQFVKDIKVDEYDNRRTSSGYDGEVTVIIPVDAALFQKDIPYIVQVRDELGRKSTLKHGKAPLPASGFDGGHHERRGDGWGQGHLQGGPPKAAGGDIMDRLLATQERHDIAPTMDALQPHVTGLNVTISSRANDDKGLREVVFKLYDSKGALLKTETLSGLGKIWSGSSPVFALPTAGAYRVTGQAFDTAGNSSKEQSATFNTGVAAPEPPVQPEPPHVPVPVPDPPKQPEPPHVPKPPVVIDGSCGDVHNKELDKAPTVGLCKDSSAPRTTETTTGWSWQCQGKNGGVSANCEARLIPLNGVCGSSHRKELPDEPTSGLCADNSTPARTKTASGWSWTCAKVNKTGADAACNAIEKKTAVEGVCGLAHGKAFDKAPTEELCKQGTASERSGHGPWTWNCAGLNGGGTANCKAEIALKAIDGECGKLQPSKTAPVDGLCSAGTKSAVIDDKTGFKWSCAGLNGGKTASCTLPKIIDGICGASSGKPFVTAPTTDLCLQGTASVRTGSNPFEWSCIGINGGKTDSCKTVTQRHTVKAVAGQGGTVSPADQQLEHAKTATITATPAAGYEVKSISGCGAGSRNGNNYTTGQVTAPCEVRVEFSKKMGEVMTVIQPQEVVNLGAQWKLDNGQWLNSNDRQSVSEGTYTVYYKDVTCWTPPKPEQVVVKVPGTTPNVVGRYDKRNYMVKTAVSGAGCTLTPQTQSVPCGTSGRVNLTVQQGHKANLSGCGINQNGVGSGAYTTQNLNADCTVQAVCAADTYTVTTSGSSVGNTITPASQPVQAGKPANYSINLQANYKAEISGTADCAMQPRTVTSNGTYQTGAINSNGCAVKAVFTKIDEQPPVATIKSNKTSYEFGETATITINVNDRQSAQENGRIKDVMFAYHAPWASNQSEQLAANHNAPSFSATRTLVCSKPGTVRLAVQANDMAGNKMASPVETSFECKPQVKNPTCVYSVPGECSSSGVAIWRSSDISNRTVSAANGRAQLKFVIENGGKYTWSGYKFMIRSVDGNVCLDKNNGSLQPMFSATGGGGSTTAKLDIDVPKEKGSYYVVLDIVDTKQNCRLKTPATTINGRNITGPIGFNLLVQ